MKDFLIAVGTCPKNFNFIKHYDDLFKFYNFDNYIYFYGTDKLNHDKSVCLNTSDCYSNLTKKTFLLFKYFIEHREEEYLVKIDDDTFIDIDELKKIDTKNYDIIGKRASLKNHMLTVKNSYKKYIKQNNLRKNYNFDYLKQIKNVDFDYTEGNFVIFSRDLIINILNTAKKIINENNIDITAIPQEDIAVGYVCSKINHKILDIKYIFFDHTFYGIDNLNIHFHPIPVILLKKMIKNKNFEDRLKLCKDFIFLNKYFLSSKK